MQFGCLNGRTVVIQLFKMTRHNLKNDSIQWRIQTPKYTQIHTHTHSCWAQLWVDTTWSSSLTKGTLLINGTATILQKPTWSTKWNTHPKGDKIDWHLTGSILCIDIRRSTHTMPNKKKNLSPLCQFACVSLAFAHTSLPLYTTIKRNLFPYVYGVCFCYSHRFEEKKHRKRLYALMVGHQLINEINLWNWHVPCIQIGFIYHCVHAHWFLLVDGIFLFNFLWYASMELR